MRLAGLALIVALAFGLLYQLRDFEETIPEPLDASTETEPDVYGKEVRFNQLRPDGTLHYRLHAETIRQFNNDQLTRMTAPELRLLNPEQPPWDIESNHGYMRKRKAPDGNLEDVVYLRDEVELEQNHPTNGLVKLRADFFYIYPDRQFAETNQDVMIDTQVGRTRAGGLKVDLATGVLKLSSSRTQRVHTIVLPEQFKNS